MGITYTSFSSSSDGNCGLVSYNGTYILLDAGISARRIVTSLNTVGVSPEEISCILVTHNHNDHVKGLPVLLKKYQLRVLSLYKGFDYLLPFSEGDIRITAFPTPHDIFGSCGFRFDTPEGSLGFATDLGMVTDTVTEMLTGAELIVLESNYDEQMLRTSPYPAALRARIASSTGHLSNKECGRMIKYLFSQGTRAAALAHLSRTNNTMDKAFSTVQNELCGCDQPNEYSRGYSLCILERDGITKLCLPSESSVSAD